MFHRDSQTSRRELKIRRAAEMYFNGIRGAWIVEETLSRVFDISTQAKQKTKE